MTVAMISGHLDLTQEEFDGKYAPYILAAMASGHHFVIGDAKGCDDMAQRFIKEWTPILNYTGRVTVYHMLSSPRFNAGFATDGGYTKDNGKDTAMTEASDYDILYIRPDKHSAVSGRVSGTEANVVRRKAKGMSAP